MSLEWQDRALCAQDSELFFSGHPADVAMAKRICGSCPVRAECQAPARKLLGRWGVLHGTWGGVSAEERRLAGMPQAKTSRAPCPRCLTEPALLGARYCPRCPHAVEADRRNAHEQADQEVAK